MFFFRIRFAYLQARNLPRMIGAGSFWRDLLNNNVSSVQMSKNITWFSALVFVLYLSLEWLQKLGFGYQFCCTLHNL